MRYLLIDFRRIADMAEFHRYIAEALKFPDYYGKNLDALFDCLTDVDEPHTLVLMNVPEEAGALGGRLEALLSVLNSASIENSNIVIKTL